MRNLLASLLLPPFILVLMAIAGALAAWRGRRRAGVLVALAAACVLVLATPLAADLLRASLERGVVHAADPGRAGAIIVLGAEAVRAGPQSHDVGPLSLERLRAGAALHRATGLPVLVTAGPLGDGQAPLAHLMARSLAADFGVTARWVEDRARDTRDNADLSAAMLRASGIGEALVVTHAWHMPRALEAFARQGFPARPAPVRLDGPPTFAAAMLVPRPDQLAMSWFALREWAGRLAYRLRDGPARPPP